MSKHDTGILHAPTAFGKTVTAIGMIARRKTNTLILVHSRQLLDQWQERLRTFLPEAEIGVIRGGKKKPTGVIDDDVTPSLTARDGGNADFAGAKICPHPMTGVSSLLRVTPPLCSTLVL